MVGERDPRWQPAQLSAEEKQSISKVSQWIANSGGGQVPTPADCGGSALKLPHDGISVRDASKQRHWGTNTITNLSSMKLAPPRMLVVKYLVVRCRL